MDVTISDASTWGIKDWARANVNSAIAIAAQSGAATCTEGPPGVAKSQEALTWCPMMGREGHLLIGSTHAPEDFSGLPIVDMIADSFRCVAPDWAKSLQKPNQVLILDELTTVPPSVRAAMLSLLTERRLGNLKIADDALIIAMCNPSHMAPNASPLEKSMANRFAHFTWEFPVVTWEEGMCEGTDVFRSGPIPMLPADWQRHKAANGTAIVEYCRNNSLERLQVPTADDVVSYPTPRTWHKLRNALAAADSVNAPAKFRSEICAAFVGKATGSTFLKYLAARDLIDVELCLDNPSLFKHSKARCDLTVAMLTSAVSAVKSRFTEKRFAQAIKLFCVNVGSETADLVFCHLKHLMALRPAGFEINGEALQDLAAFGKRIPQHLRANK